MLGNFGRFRKNWFGGDALLVAWVYGFDCWGDGFGGLVEIWVWGLVLCSGDWLWGRTQRTRTCLEKIMKGIKKKSTRKIQKMIRK